MYFNSFAFLVFFACFFTLYWSLRGTPRLVLCLAASYFFYGWWDYRFLSLIVVSTIVDYLVGLALAANQSPGVRRVLVASSVVTNLGILATFKYWDFFAESLQSALASVGLSADWPTLNLILPAGISFYTFQTLSYSIDVYCGILVPERNLLRFATFVSFFPQLVAGPIVRATEFLPQLQSDRTFRWKEFEGGFRRVLQGFFKKLVIADSIAMVADPLFRDPESFTAVNTIILVVLDAFQVYGDFSGYSDIAIGLSRMLGFRLPENFCVPYLATSPADFWHRWHITLSTWLRDYLYIPLGGSRRGHWLTYRNLSITMLLGGLWHGASWNFVIWGAIHAVLLVLHRAWVTITGPEQQPEVPIMILPPRPESTDVNAWWAAITVRLAKSAILFAVVCLAWVFFRSPTLGMAIQIISQMVPLDGFNLSLQNRIPLIKACGLVSILVLAECISQLTTLDRIVHQSPLIRSVYLASIVWMIALFGTFTGTPFIYFQF